MYHEGGAMAVSSLFKLFKITLPLSKVTEYKLLMSDHYTYLIGSSNYSTQIASFSLIDQQITV